jgi:glutamate-1-semialdehyde aminotransferase
VSPSPLFLVAPGRSGSTLLYELLRTHPSIALTDEEGIFDLLYFAHRWASLPKDREERFELERPVRMRGIVSAEAAESFASLFAQHARDMLLTHYRRRFPDRNFRWFGDKMPHPLAARAALEAFGGGRWIVLVRDPRDVACSARAYARRSDIARSSSHLEVGLRARLEHWRNFYAAALAEADERSWVRYEELLLRPAAVAERVLRSLDLDPQPLDASDMARIARRFEWHGTSPSLESTVGRWQRELSAEELELADEICGPLIERLGYARHREEPRTSFAASGTSEPPAGVERESRAGQQATEDLASAASDGWWRRAQSVLAAGTWTMSQGAHRYPGGLFPVLARSGRGARLIDTAGRSYVDWVMGWGAVLLGYRQPEVEREIQQQLAEGPLLTLAHPLEVEVAEMLRDQMPCAEAVAFGKNGSDVLAAAVRIARAKTARELVLVCGYHGFHDWYLASIPTCAGIPSALRGSVRHFTWGDLPALERLLASAPVAAIVLEPASGHLPQPGFLHGMRELATAHGALLVFDEVLTFLRLAAGGAEETYGVRPDLACLGKSLANGMPLSALVGPKDHLRYMPKIGYGLTFRGETLSLAAARATLRVAERSSASQQVNRIGSELRSIFDGAARESGATATLHGFDARTSAHFTAQGPLSSLVLQTLFVQGCLERGVITNGNFLPSLAHGPEELEITREAFRHGFELVARAVERGSVSGLLRIEARPHFFTSASHEDMT